MAVSTVLGMYYKGPPICRQCLAKICERAYVWRDANECDKENGHA